MKRMVVTKTTGPAEDVDHQAVGAAISTISSNLPDMAKGVKLIAALMEDDHDGDRLLDATRKLCKAFSDLMNAAQPENKEVRVLTCHSSFVSTVTDVDRSSQSS
jgi:talin